MSLKRKSLAVEAFAADDEDVAAFDRVLLGVGQLVRQPVLPGFGGRDLLPGLALRVRCRAFQVCTAFSTGLPFSSYVMLVQRQLAFALDRLAVQRLGLEAGLDVSPTR